MDPSIPVGELSYIVLVQIFVGKFDSTQVGAPILFTSPFFPHGARCSTGAPSKGPAGPHQNAPRPAGAVGAQVSFNVAIAALGGAWWRSWDLLRELRDHGLEGDVASYMASERT